MDQFRYRIEWVRMRYRELSLFWRLACWVALVLILLRVVLPVRHTPNGEVFWVYPLGESSLCAMAGDSCEIDRSRTFNTAVSFGMLFAAWLIFTTIRYTKHIPSPMIDRPEPHQKFPADAKKVFSGVLFDVFQWQQQLFDGRMVTYERLKRHDSVVVLAVTKEGKLLLQREQQPGTGWYESAPCGSIDAGEDPEQAARRELLEETGYVPAQMELWYSEQIDHRTDWAIYTFIARGCTKQRESDPGAGERVEAREVSFDDFVRAVASDNFKNSNLAPRLLRAAIAPEEMIALKKRLGVQ